MAATPGAPGPKYPERYPVAVGPKYLYYGEQPGWIYNPYTDKYEPDPKVAQKWGEQAGLVEPEPSEPGLVEQLAPVAAGSLALYGGKYVAEEGIPGLFSGADTAGSLAGTATNAGTQAGVNASQAALEAPNVVSVSREAATQAAKEAAIEAGKEAAAQGATEAAAQEAGQQAAAEAAAESGWGETLGTAATWAGYAYEAYQIYKISQSDLSNEQKGREIGKRIGLAVADAWTFGGASLAYAALGSSKEWQEFEEKTYPYDAVGQSFGSAGKIAGGEGDSEDWANLLTHGGFNLVKDTFGGGTKSDEDYRKERWGKAYHEAATDQDKEAVDHFYNIAKEAAAGDAIFKEGPLAGRKWNEAEVKATARPEDIWGVYGFFEAFPDWMTGFNEDQRRTVAQAALDENLLEWDNGQGLFSGKRGNLDRIRQIGQQVKEGGYQASITDDEREAKRQQAISDITGGLGTPAPGMMSTPEQAPQQQVSQAPVEKGREPGGPGMMAPTEQIQEQGRGGGVGAYQPPQQQGQGLGMMAPESAYAPVQRQPAGDQTAQEVAALKKQIEELKAQRTSTRSPGIGLDGRPIQY